MFTLPFGRGRGIPRPYRAMFFIALVSLVCRGRIYASRAVYPLGRFAGMAATAVNDRPYKLPVMLLQP